MAEVSRCDRDSEDVAVVWLCLVIPLSLLAFHMHDLSQTEFGATGLVDSEGLEAVVDVWCCLA